MATIFEFPDRGRLQRVEQVVVNVLEAMWHEAFEPSAVVAIQIMTTNPHLPATVAEVESIVVDWQEVGEVLHVG